jgi:hypothetical protein
VRPCAEEEDIARELLLSLDSQQRSAATLSKSAPPDFVLLNAPGVPDACLPGDVGTFPPLQQSLRSLPNEQREALAFSRAAPRGIPAADLNRGQEDLLVRLVRVYIDRLPDDLSAAELERVDAGSLHFAWAGSEHPGEGHYYRIQGGPLLVEYDNTQDRANHVHAVWRDMARDFGGDALRRHIADSHQK